MKKLILVGLLLVSWVYGKSVEQVQNEWLQRYDVKNQEWQMKNKQNEEFMRLTPHCFQANDKGACERILNIHNKQCNNGSARACAAPAIDYIDGNEQMGIKADLKKAQSYADKVCTMDATICASMSGLFMYKNRKLALKYAEKACEMGEISDCVVAAELYAVGFGGIGKNPQKVKYYTDKLCKGGVSETCGK